MADHGEPGEESVVGRAAEDDGARGGRAAGTSSGFTLIEMMVVLLIMAVLIAIALPTFLGVSASAIETASQADLSTALTASKAAYVRTLAFPTTATADAGQANAKSFQSKLHSDVSTITFVPSIQPLGTRAGDNVVSALAFSADVAVYTAEDRSGGCWGVVDNESPSPLATSHIPAGVGYAWYKTGSAPTTQCDAANMVLHAGTRTLWKSSPAAYSKDP